MEERECACLGERARLHIIMKNIRGGKKTIIGHSQQEENMRRIQSVGGVITSVTHWRKKSDVMLEFKFSKVSVKQIATACRFV